MLNAAGLLPGQIVQSLLLNVAQVSQPSPCNIWTLQKWSKENRNVSLFLIGHSLDWAGWQIVPIIAGVNCLVAIDFEQNLVIKFPSIQWDRNQSDDDSFVLKIAQQLDIRPTEKWKIESVWTQSCESSALCQQCSELWAPCAASSRSHFYHRDFITNEYERFCFRQTQWIEFFASGRM